ncbi:MAG: serpin family protein [Terracidiphilus sp.]|jgi:serpin B
MKVLLFSLIACLLLSPAGSSAETSPSTEADRSAVVDENNAFAVALYGKLRNQNGNLFFSPESVSTALAMTYAGARGDTAAEMAKTLHFTLPPERLHPALGALLGDLNAAHQGYQLHIANALWAQQDYRILDDFLRLNKADYGAGFNRVDFKSAPEAARLTINRWVERKTEDKIKNLIQQGVLDSSTRLVLTDTIYLKSNWQTQFEKRETEDGDFNVSPIRNVTAAMMHRTDGFNYFKGDAFRALEIPYKNLETSLIIFLPDKLDGLSDLERSLTAPNLRRWLEQLRTVPKVMLAMPRFTVTEEFELKGTLDEMGMTEAFDRELADFSGITRSRKLFLSAMIHKTFIDVDEEGTEASAASAFGVMGAIFAAREEPPIPFTVDHPFVFLIRDNRSGSILFMGRMTDPTK